MGLDSDKDVIDESPPRSFYSKLNNKTDIQFNTPTYIYEDSGCAGTCASFSLASLSHSSYMYMHNYITFSLSLLL